MITQLHCDFTNFISKYTTRTAHIVYNRCISVSIYQSRPRAMKRRICWIGLSSFKSVNWVAIMYFFLHKTFTLVILSYLKTWIPNSISFNTCKTSYHTYNRATHTHTQNPPALAYLITMAPSTSIPNYECNSQTLCPVYYIKQLINKVKSLYDLLT